MRTLSSATVEMRRNWSTRALGSLLQCSWGKEKPEKGTSGWRDIRDLLWGDVQQSRNL